MKYLTAASAALILAASVTSANAQTSPSPDGSVIADLLEFFAPAEARRLSTDDRQRWLERRIDSGARDGTLTDAEVRRLRGEARDLARLELTYRSGGFDRREQADLDRRFDALSAQVYRERSDSQGRWASVNERQQRLDTRIDIGVREGDLTRVEARALRQEFRRLARLEAQYRAGGLSGWERADLDRRFDALSARIRDDRTDRQERGRASINERQEELGRRIDAGIRDGTITAREGERLHEEFRAIVRLEADYRRRGGITVAERADLDARLDQLRNRIRSERYDRQARTR